MSGERLSNIHWLLLAKIVGGNGRKIEFSREREREREKTEALKKKKKDKKALQLLHAWWALDRLAASQRFCHHCTYFTAKGEDAKGHGWFFSPYPCSDCFFQSQSLSLTYWFSPRTCFYCQGPHSGTCATVGVTNALVSLPKEDSVLSRCLSYCAGTHEEAGIELPVS